MHHFSDHGERANRAGADTWNSQQRGKILGTSIGCRGYRSMQATHHDIAFANVMVRRHDQMRKQRLLLLCLLRFQPNKLAHDAIRPKPVKQVDLRLAGGRRPAIGKIDDPALARTVNGTVRLLDEAFQSLGLPVIAAGLPLVAVHALLHNHPFGIFGDNEAVQIKIEAILHRRAVDFGNQTTRVRQCGAVEAYAISKRDQLLRCLSRVRAPASANIQAKLPGEGRQSALQGADDAGGNAGRVPIHAHHRAEGLEPVWMSKASKQVVAPVVVDNGLADHGPEPCHAIAQPFGDTATMKR